MKKFASILLAGLMALSLFAGCSSEVTSTDDGSSAVQASSSGTESQAESNGSSEDAYAGLSGTLTLNGSTSMTAVCNALGEAFMAKYDGVTVEKANTGSGSAVTAVNDGTALIGDLSRKVKDDEDPDGKFTKVTIALDGIAIAVNPENPVDALTSEQIEKIFAGEITNWSEVGGDDAARKAPVPETALKASSVSARIRNALTLLRFRKLVLWFPRLPPILPPSAMCPWLLSMMKSRLCL